MSSFVSQTEHDGPTSHFWSTEHLGTEAVAAFVDGELTATARKRAQEHLLACPECRREVARQHLAAQRLRDSAALRIPSELRSRLAQMRDMVDNAEVTDAVADMRALAKRRPESLLAAVEQLMRELRRGGLRP